jgi:hypothetical protein
MRRPVHPYRVLSLVVLAAALMLAGCAEARTGTAAPGPEVATSQPEPTPILMPSAGDCGRGQVQNWTAVVNEHDNGKALCLATGTHLEVYLQGTATDKWTNPVSDNDALIPAPSGKGALAVGVSAGFFVGDHPGHAKVTATRDGTRFAIDVTIL